MHGLRGDTLDFAKGDSMLKRRARSFLFPVLLSLCGCTSLPTADELVTAPAPHLAADSPSGIVDGRARFRAYFCAASTECDRWLHRLPGEAPMQGNHDGDRPGLQVLFVTGAFSECFGEGARPFARAIDELAGGDDRFATIVVGGRSGSEANARQIAAYLDENPADPERPLVLIGYSKGTTDILQFLVDFPDQASAVDAVVSIAGSVGGSPLADRYGGLYNLTLSHLPTGRCEKGDGEVVNSLRTDVRRSWLAKNELPEHIRYYSFTAFTVRDRVARALVTPWKLLLKLDRRNDGQLLPRDTLLPNSTLLGYLNADHWAVAMRLEEDLEFFAARHDTAQFPHTALLEAILQYVGEDAAGDNTHSGQGR
jgi:hypothetical protein